LFVEEVSGTAKNWQPRVVRSPAASATNEDLMIALDSAPIVPAVGAEDIEIVQSEPIPAFDGATERVPKPNAATATSAMRLKVVFVDICFLSISQAKEFPPPGLGNKCPLICHEKTHITRFGESHVLIHQIPHRVSGRGEETYLFVCHLHRLREDGGLA
jgi:hypothetical protein